MKIAGYVPNSFVDYPGKIAMLVFTPGCNMNCWYCHNAHLIREKNTTVLYSPAMLLADLERKKNFLDAVVISGGEPTLHKGIEVFARQVKSLGYLVKLDTNGTNPQKVKDMLDEGLLDYIAMDIKAPLDKYQSVCRRPVSLSAIEASIDLLMHATIDCEFRTTFSPDLTCEDVLQIADLLQGAQRYTLQQYRPTPQTMDRPAHTPDYVRQCAKKLEHRFPQFRVLGL